MNFSKIREEMENSVFCYSKKPEQGFIRKEHCQCFAEGKKCCDAYFEREDFHNLYKEFESQGYARKEIIKKIEEKYKWEETSWIQYNVIK